MNKPTFSISMTLYNNEKYITEAIESVLNQTYKNFELIIVDDRSTDNSWNLVWKYCEKDDRIIIFKNKEHTGVAGAHKLAFHLAKGKYIVIVDSDDVIVSTALEEMKNFIDQHQDCGFWYSNYSHCDENLNRLRSGPNHFPVKGNTILKDKDAVSHLKVLRKADYFKHPDGIDIKYFKAFDRDLVLRMEEVCKFAYYDKELYLWRGNPKGISRRDGAKEALKYYRMACDEAVARRKNNGKNN